MTTVGEHVDSVATWNPKSTTTAADTFGYIDLSSVDQVLKEVLSVSQVVCAEAPSRARQLVQAGDVLVSTVRPNLNGVAHVPA